MENNHSDMSLSVIIPLYNEELTIKTILEKVCCLNNLKVSLLLMMAPLTHHRRWFLTSIIRR